MALLIYAFGLTAIGRSRHAAPVATAEAQRRWRARKGAWSGHPGRRPTAPCGTLAAHKRHVRHGESPCDLCRIAASAERQRRRVWHTLSRPDRFSWLLHRRILDRLLVEPEKTLAVARDRLGWLQTRDAFGHEAELHGAWQRLLDGPFDQLERVLVGLDDRSTQLRSTTPFIGVVSLQERDDALAISKRV